jgi:hypothetical protein
MYPRPIHFYSGPPSLVSGFPVNPFIFAASDTILFPAVLAIFSTRRDSKIFSPIIQTIVVYMIYLFVVAKFSIQHPFHNHAMHQHASHTR